MFKGKMRAKLPDFSMVDDKAALDPRVPPELIACYCFCQAAERAGRGGASAPELQERLAVSKSYWQKLRKVFEALNALKAVPRHSLDGKLVGVEFVFDLSDLRFEAVDKPLRRYDVNANPSQKGAHDVGS